MIGYITAHILVTRNTGLSLDLDGNVYKFENINCYVRVFKYPTSLLFWKPCWVS